MLIIRFIGSFSSLSVVSNISISIVVLLELVIEQNTNILEPINPLNVTTK